MRLETLAAIAWFISKCWMVNAAGRKTSRTIAMPSSHDQEVASSISGLLSVTSVTTLPMKTGIITSSSATTKPMANRPMNSAFACRGEMPIESGQAGWRLGIVRHRGRCE